MLLIYIKKIKLSTNKLTKGKRMNCYELLEEVKKTKDLRNNAHLADFLNISRQSINGIKNGGGMSEAICKKVAKATNRKLEQVLLINQIQKEKDTVLKKAWERISEASGIAASFFVFFQIVSPLEAIKNTIECILC